MEKYLSPSRRRALRPFFVQSHVVVQTRLQPRPVAGSGRHVAIALGARLCREMSRAYTARCSTAGNTATMKAPAGLGENLENTGEPLFSNSELLWEQLTWSHALK